MLRQFILLQNKALICRQDFGKSLDMESLQAVLEKIIKDSEQEPDENINIIDFFNYRMAFSKLSNFNLIFMFTLDLTDTDERIIREMKKCKKEFVDMYQPILEVEPDLEPETLEIFEPVIDILHKNLRPKISLVGFSGVGKTTITRLIKEQDIPLEHVPTITGDIGTIKIGKLHFNLWDFAGQEQFSFLWNKFVQGSDAVFIITDSSIENIDKSRFFTELIEKEVPHAHVAIIGNKQDLPEALPMADIERILKKKAYPMIATDPKNRAKMIQIIGEVLQISEEISPLLKPLKEKNEKLEEAEEALQAGDMKKAADLFEELSQICFQLGDDQAFEMFQDRAFKIRDAVEDSTTSTQAANPAVKPPVVLQPPIKDPNASVEQLKKDIKIRMLTIDKKILELETQNIMGEISNEEFNQKSERLKGVKEKFAQQLAEI